MNANRLSLVAAMTVGGLLIFNSGSQAADTNTNAAHHAERRGPTVQQRAERLSSELNLDADQKTKVTALLEKQAKQRREVMGDTSLPREERRDKMRALMQDENKQLKAILTSEQFEKWKKLREQNRPRHQGGTGEPGAHPPAPAPAPAPQPKSGDNQAQ